MLKKGRKTVRTQKKVAAKPAKKSSKLTKKVSGFQARKKTKKTVLPKKVKRNKVKRESANRNKKGFREVFSEFFHKRNDRKTFDKPLLILFIFFILAGIIMVLDTSMVFAERSFGNKFHFLILQSMWIFIGFIGFLAAYFIDYKFIRKFIVFFYIITILLLMATLFTHSVNGAKSWIDLGGITLQPSEIAKMTFILYAAGNLSQIKKWSNAKEFLQNDVIPFAILLFLVVIFVVLGKDLGTSIIIVSVALLMYLFKSKTRYEYIALICMVGVCVIGATGLIVMESYRGDRVQVFTNALTTGNVINDTGSGYQQKQILIALGRGGLTGVGFAESLQIYDLVETTAATDSVIAIIAEEFGLLGSLTVLSLFLFYIFRGLKIASQAKDTYGQTVAVGIVSWIGMQTFLHIASNVVVTPLTGVPLPFLSYGGSSILSCMIATGILLNISRK